MSLQARGQNLLVGRGALFVDRWNSSGARTGWDFMGNVQKLEITPNDEVKQKYSATEAAAPMVKQIVTRRSPEFTLTADEYTMTNLALALMGEVGPLTQGSTPVTDEVLVAACKLGTYVKTALRKPGTLTLETDSTPLVLGTDYTVYDADAGLIYLLPTATALADGDPVTASYTPGSLTGVEKISAGTATFVDASLLFIGDNASGANLEIEVWHVNINADGPLGLITEDFGSFGLKGVVLSDLANHATEPYFRVIKRS